MLKKIFVIIAAIIVVFLIIVALQPAHFRVARTTTIAAPPAAVFPLVNNFHQWDGWSPWAKIDPAMKQTYEGPGEGVGAIYKWEGNSEVGQGAMTITGSQPASLVSIKLEFIKPFAAVNTTEFSFKPEGNQTTVEWSMAGDNNFMAKAMCLFVSMDKMVGGDFEKGLAQMKTAAEAGAKK